MPVAAMETSSTGFLTPSGSRPTCARRPIRVANPTHRHDLASGAPAGPGAVALVGVPGRPPRPVARPHVAPAALRGARGHDALGSRRLLDRARAPWRLGSG